MAVADPFHAIIVAGGRGVRSGMPQPKQYALLGGRMVLCWSIAAFASHPGCRSITLVVPAGDEARCNAVATDVPFSVTAGGETRQASVAAGLNALESGGHDDSAPILIHDAARPGLTAAVIDRLLMALADPQVDGAVPALAVADTLSRHAGALGDVVPREEIVRIQTPQAFRWAAIMTAHRSASGPDASDDAQLVRRSGGTIAIVEGSASLDKITTAEDFARMNTLLVPPSRIAVGTGFDVHRLIPGDGLWLGGIRIPHDRTLEGHSDADVALHAITDALLGALGAGDIGDHFPPTDPQWRGASSDRFLDHARAVTASRGGAIQHVDCTIICEAPRIGPHRAAMVARIAAILAIPAECVSVKATTTERLGFAGRGEGIAAQACVTVSLPQTAGPC